jgi:hypothetical protein
MYCDSGNEESTVNWQTALLLKLARKRAYFGLLMRIVAGCARHNPHQQPVKRAAGATTKLLWGKVQRRHVIGYSRETTRTSREKLLCPNRPDPEF